MISMGIDLIRPIHVLEHAWEERGGGAGVPARAVGHVEADEDRLGGELGGERGIVLENGAQARIDEVVGERRRKKIRRGRREGRGRLVSNLLDANFFSLPSSTMRRTQAISSRARRTQGKEEKKAGWAKSAVQSTSTLQPWGTEEIVLASRAASAMMSSKKGIRRGGDISRRGDCGERTLDERAEVEKALELLVDVREATGANERKRVGDDEGLRAVGKAKRVENRG